MSTWPDFCTASLDRRLAAITGAHRRMPVENINDAATAAARRELEVLRKFVDGQQADAKLVDRLADGGFWPRVGYRALTDAWDREVKLARIRAAVESGILSHITMNHPVNPDSVNIYHRDPGSPTGCRLAVSFDRKDTDAMALVANRSIVAGGTRGAGAVR